jgi:hypothetical protein
LKLRGVVLSREKCSCLRCLCAAGCNIDIRNSDNIRADITALKYGHNDVADLLDRLRATGQRDTLARQLVPTSKPALRLSLRLLGHSGVGKTSLVKSLGAGLFSSLFRRSSSLQSNKCKSYCWPTLSPKALSSATVVAHQHPNRDGRDFSTELSQFREQWQLPVHQRDPRTKCESRLVSHFFFDASVSSRWTYQASATRPFGNSQDKKTIFPSTTTSCGLPRTLSRWFCSVWKTRRPFRSNRFASGSIFFWRGNLPICLRVSLCRCLSLSS